MSASEPRTVSDAVAALRAREVTSVELTERAFAISDACDESVGMFLKRFKESALSTARAVDDRIVDGQPVGKLAGIPIAVKDVIGTREAVTTAQSLVLDPAWSDGDAEVVARLRAADAVIMGKTTASEFAIGNPDPEKPFPIPKNPWDLARTPGGSSSGSASAVATGAVLGALGTDTGGSIRIPAAWCGITGLMPTMGRVPKTGCVPLGYTLDHVGPMARSAKDCALLLSVLAGHHSDDVTSIDVSSPDYLKALSGDLTGVRIGVDRIANVAGEVAEPALPAVLDQALEVLRARGARIVDVRLPLYAELAAAFAVIMAGEASAYHARTMQTRWTDYFVATRAVIGAGIFYSAADYVQAQRVRRVGQKRVGELFADVDLVVTPTVSMAAPTIEELDQTTAVMREGEFGPIHTPYWSVTGNPALSVPIGCTAGGLPLAMQIAGRPFHESLVLRAGDAYQQETTWHLQVPPLVAEAAARADQL